MRRQGEPAAPTTIGQQAEQAARRFLEGKGLRFRHSNYRCRRGEIDLIMSCGETLVFVEVRYRRSRRFGSAAESIGREKQRRLTIAASLYLQQYPASARQACRFDVVAIHPSGNTLEIEWFQNAFEAEGP